jgi:2-polyprenyl-3-methyl-5-hydroxy-6-metoxy-1,4-benzoquinol methylase
MEQNYYPFVYARIRGHIKRLGVGFDNAVMEKELFELDECDKGALIEYARANEIKLYPFKKSERILPRVGKVLGFLKSIYFESLLDVGSGRGAFLFPLLDTFSYINVTSLDILEKRVQMLSDVALGGVHNLSVRAESICDTPLPENSFDVVCMLEVLEHIPNVMDAIKSAVRVAKNYVVVTVPAKEDDNPEHIHLLTQDVLTKYFNELGVNKLSFEQVQEHLFMIAKI